MGKTLSPCAWMIGDIIETCAKSKNVLRWVVMCAIEHERGTVYFLESYRRWIQ